MFLKSNERSEVKNKHIVRSRISEKKFREILKYFSEDIEVSKISNLTKISEVTLCKIFREIRILMSKECEKISKFSSEFYGLQAYPEVFLYINPPAAPLRLFYRNFALLVLK